MFGTVAAGQADATPSRIWRDAERVILRCTLSDGARALLGDDFCGHVVTEAGRDATLPVMADEGMARPADAGTIIIDLVADMAAGTGADLGKATSASAVEMTMTIRPAVERSEGDMSVLSRQFDTGHDGPYRAEAVRTAAALFDRLLPWRAPARHGRATIRRTP